MQKILTAGPSGLQTEAAPRVRVGRQGCGLFSPRLLCGGETRPRTDGAPVCGAGAAELWKPASVNPEMNPETGRGDSRRG